MKHFIITCLVLTGLFSSCKKDFNCIKSNAEIIKFNPLKCGCCWGWTIKIGNDIIKSDDSKIGEIVGYEIENPIKVYIELGEVKETCIDYYNIKEIKKIE